MHIENVIKVFKETESGDSVLLSESIKSQVLSALEKQIAVEPFTEYDDEFDCPTCGAAVEDYDVTTLKVCPECGQKLTWQTRKGK